MQDRVDSSDSADRTPAEGVWPAWIQEADVHEELPSTQDEARRLVADGTAKLPFFVQAVRQTAGRGRGGNRWSAGEGALAFTLAFEPAALGLGQDRVATLSIATALAVCESLQRYSPTESLAIKWPNDVYAAGRKLCGILIETLQRPGGGSPVAVVGIGANVNNDVPTSAVEGRVPAINLAELAGERIAEANRFHELLSPLLATLEREYRALAAREARQVERWNARNLLQGRRCRILQKQGGEELVGVADVIAADGALRLLTEAGPITLRSGSIVGWD